MASMSSLSSSRRGMPGRKLAAAASVTTISPGCQLRRWATALMAMPAATMSKIWTPFTPDSVMSTLSVGRDWRVRMDDHRGAAPPIERVICRAPGPLHL
jgi:hypothetical protein